MRYWCPEGDKNKPNPSNAKICRHPCSLDPSVFWYDNFKIGVKIGVCLSQFAKQRVVSVKLNYYTQAAAASQPNPLRVMTGSSSVKSKMVDT
ncbi:MAG: hypothetical protein RLZZ507_3959 [Cyanobacteriota bacterium]